VNEPAEPETPPTANNTERLFLRLTFWQTVLSLVGVFIAVVALYAALNESAAVRQQTAAAVWPYVQFSINETESEEGASFAFYFTNTGVGPARMRTMKVEMLGESMSDWRSVLDLLQGEATDNISRNFITNRVLAPGERVTAFETTDPDLRRRLTEAAQSDESRIQFCYCSIFDDCWLVDSKDQMIDPEPVAACPDFGDDAFIN